VKAPNAAKAPDAPPLAMSPPVQPARRPAESCRKELRALGLCGLTP
jgi:hypothetical protein